MALAVPWDGAADHAAWMASANHLVPLVAVTRDGGEGRTTLTRAGRVRIDYRLDATGIATLRHALGSMARIARAAGAVEILAAATPIVRHDTRAGDDEAGEPARFEAFLARLARMDFAPNRAAVFSAHQMGTVRMGAPAADHAADSRGRVRGPRGAIVPGLYVADASTFPPAIGVNPMLAVMTIARRVARTVRAEGQPRG
jgi:choline dehydrogenase-like flavoprotein